MKILVTGANGYIGRHVVKALLDKGADVIACDIITADVDPRAERHDFDLFKLSDGNIFEQLGSPDVCLHMAWRNGFEHNASTHIGDLSAHYMFLTRMIDEGVKQLAVMGTMHEVGYWEGAINENTPCNPISMYGIAKDALRRAMLLYCSQHDCVLQWLRCYYIHGDDSRNHSIFAKICQAEAEGREKFPFTSGKAKYDFIEVDELADQLSATVMQYDETGIINCCSGNPVSLGERVERFIKENGFKIKLEYGAFPDRPYDSPIIFGDNSRIKRIMSRNLNIEREI